MKAFRNRRTRSRCRDDVLSCILPAVVELIRFMTRMKMMMLKRRMSPTGMSKPVIIGHRCIKHLAELNKLIIEVVIVLHVEVENENQRKGQRQ